ncbi:MAG: hypothetical protein IPP94_15120 [Ignavibacteria bacterium]|nr:hypothetical protein [Ignavibacteria bacterium]
MSDSTVRAPSSGFVGFLHGPIRCLHGTIETQNAAMRRRADRRDEKKSHWIIYMSRSVFLNGSISILDAPIDFFNGPLEFFKGQFGLSGVCSFSWKDKSIVYLPR